MNRRGFTLIEVVLYLAVVSLVMGSLLSISIRLVQSRQDIHTRARVEKAAQELFLSVSKEIQKSGGVHTVSSTLSQNPSNVYLYNKDNEPQVRLFVEDELFYIEEIGEQPVRLVSQDVRVRSFVLDPFVTGTLHDSFRLSLDIVGPRSQDAVRQYVIAASSTITIR